jgi:signal transduction histidine kinase
MMVVSAIWIALLLGGGGYALDRVLTSASRATSTAARICLTALIASAEVGPDGEAYLNRPPATSASLSPIRALFPDQRGRQAARDRRPRFPVPLAVGPAPARRENHNDSTSTSTTARNFRTRRCAWWSATSHPRLAARWRFQVAEQRDALDDQISVLRRTLVRSFGILGLGLIVLATLQAIYGLWPLRRVQSAIASIRSGQRSRVEELFPREIEPLKEELNALLAHNENQAEEARRHAGNLAHALKTPLTVITNAATAGDPDLGDTVCREATTMRRQVDHHLARARAIGRRSSAQARADVWPALEAVERAVSRLYENATVDLAGHKDASVRVERQDLDEMLGNLIENAAKYGGGRVFVTVNTTPECVEIEVEDDGTGIPEEERESIFSRGARLDTGKPGTGLGLAIVRDVAEIYGGSIVLEESEDLGGLMARLKLPLCG